MYYYANNFESDQLQMASATPLRKALTGPRPGWDLGCSRLPSWTKYSSKGRNSCLFQTKSSQRMLTMLGGRGIPRARDCRADCSRLVSSRVVRGVKLTCRVPPSCSII